MRASNYWTRWAQRSHSRRRLLAQSGALGVGLAALGTVGCGGDDDDDTGGGNGDGGATGSATTDAGSTQPEGGAQQGGVITWPLGSALKDVFDPHTSLNQAAMFFSVMGNTALRTAVDATTIDPELVESHETPGDGTEILLTIRPGVTWHNKPPTNGRAFTTDDLAFSLTRITGALNPDNKASFQRASTLPNFESADVVDETTVSVKLSAPHSGFLWGLSDWRNSIVPRDFVESGGDFADPMALVGTGPWILESFENDVRGVYKPNPDYWEEGKPLADQMDWVFYGDALSAQTAFAQGDVSYNGALGKVGRETMKQIAPNAREEEWIFGNWDFIRFNFTRPPFDDPRVRLAFFHIFDYKGWGDGFYGEGAWDYTGPLAAAFTNDAIPSDEIQQMPGYNPDTRDADIQTGKEMLASAGFPDGAGLSFKIFTVAATGAQFEQATRARDNLLQALPELDCELDIASDPTVYATRQVSGDWDVISYTLYPAPDSVIEMTNNVHSTGARNYGHFANDDVDALIAKAETTLDLEERSLVLKDLQHQLIDVHMPTIHSLMPRQRAFFQPDVQGMTGYGGRLGGGATWDTLLNWKNAWISD